MKKFLLLALFAAGTGALHAQGIKAGTVSLGGSMGYLQETQKSQRTFGGTTYSQELTVHQLTLSPSVGYFLADNIALGLDLGYISQGSSYTQSPGSGNSTTDSDPDVTFRIGPYAQYYKMFGEQFGAVGTLGAGFQSTKGHFTTSDQNGNPVQRESKNSGYYAALTPGIVFFPIPKFGISASIGSLGYTRVTLDPPTGVTVPKDYENSESQFGLSFGLDKLQFGGTFYFGR